jgi:2-phosphosulfolactate phosphatase
MSEPARLFVHLLPAWIPQGALFGGVAVVIDVLRATSVMVQALASGCQQIFPCGEVQEARDLAASLTSGTAILAGERHGLPIEGFDLGNSPDDFTPERCRGRTLVMTTTNGTRAILASLGAETIWVASFGNRAAVLKALRDEDRPIHLVCSGTEGQVSLEDTLLAGALVDGLGRETCACDDTALIAQAAWRSLTRGDVGPGVLATALKRGKGGRRVVEIGLEADLLAASRIDHHGTLLPEVLRVPVRVVRAATGPS